MRRQHRKIKNKETVNYTLSLPADLYTDMREVSHQKNISLAYLMQTAIEKYVDDFLKDGQKS